MPQKLVLLNKLTNAINFRVKYLFLYKKKKELRKTIEHLQKNLAAHLK